jgi:flagellar hook-associated protein 2
MASTGALSSLGIGSGTLTYDIIEQLKSADEAGMVSPLETRLSNTQEKISSLKSLMTNIALLKGSANDFAGGALMDKRLTNVTGDSVTASAINGTDTQTIKIDVEKLAENDVYQSVKFESEDTVINSTGSSQEITLNINGVEESIYIANDATLTDLKDAINNSNMEITASIIDTGSENEPYQLILRGDKTGSDYNIKMDFSDIDDIGFNATSYQSKEYTSDADTITDSDTSITFNINGDDYSMDVAAGTTVSDFVSNLNLDENMQEAGVSATYNSDTNKIEFNIKAIGEITIDEGDLNSSINDETTFENANRLQSARNSEFTFNGVSITRSSNTIDDLVVGLTMNLKDEGESTINIERDNNGIVDSIDNFFSGYNSLMSTLDSKTDYNLETETAAIFQGESAITGIQGKLNADVFNYYISSEREDTDLNGNLYTKNVTLTASDFGFSLSGLGYVEFDGEAFKEMLSEHGDDAEKFISDMFDRLKEDLDGLVTGSDSSLESLSSRYSREETSFQEEILKTQDSIDKKYEIMVARFASYDSMISGYQNMSSTLNMQIEAFINN